MRIFGATVRFAAALGLLAILSACGDTKPDASGGGTTGGSKVTSTDPNAPDPIPAPTASAPGKNRRIVFIFKVAGLGYSETCKKGAMQANDELKSKGVSVEYLAPDKAEVSDQIQIMNQMIAAKVDAIVLSPNDAKAIAPIIKKASEAGVKVFTWDSDAPGSQRIFYVAAADDVQIGVDIADALAKDIGGKGKVQLVSGGQGAYNLNQHLEGFKQGFAKYPGITMVDPIIYNDDDNVKARSMAVAALQKDPDIVGFACANSPSPPAVGEAVTQLNKIGKIKVYGLALPSETRQYLKSGAISGVLLWDPTKLTYLTAKLVNDYLDGKAPADGSTVADTPLKVKNRAVLIPGVTFTKENVDQYQF